MKKAICWLIFCLGIAGMWVSLFLFWITHNPIAAFNIVWAFTLALSAVMVGDLKLVRQKGR